MTNTTTTVGRQFGTPYRVGATASHGEVVGQTYYDWQHNGSTGRQVDENLGVIQVAWMNQVLPQASPGRDVRLNRANVTGSPTPVALDNGDSISILPIGNVLTPGIGTPFGPEQSGYINLRLKPSGQAIAYFHAVGGFASFSASVDNSLGIGVFADNIAPQPVGAQYVDDPVIWPKGTYEVTTGGDTAVHVVGTFSGEGSEFWYWRGTLTGTSIVWNTPIFMDTAGFITSVVEAKADTVIVAYTKPYSDAGNDDIVYRRSNDAGLTFGSYVNITNYNDLSTEYAYLDLDLLFDPDGVFHIVWSTLFHDLEDDATLVLPTNLNHWNSQRNSIRTVTTGNWPNFGEDGCSEQGQNGLGSNTVMFSKMNLAVKPANAGPGAGIPDELLYCIWVQGGPTDPDTLTGDCATVDSTTTPGGYVNMELYCSVSSDKGFTWDRPSNLTGTETPRCQPGDCHSENWVSVAAVADSGIYISYTDDHHPAGAILAAGPQGEWSIADYMIMAPVTRLPVVAPVIGVGPQVNFVELNADTVGTSQITVDIANLGNATLNFNVIVTNDDLGQSFVLVNGGSTFGGSVGPGGAPVTLTIDYNGVGLPNPSEHNWRLEVTSNDELNDPGQGGTPIDIDMNVFVANPWFTCVQDSIGNANVNLAVSACLEIGDQGGGGGLRNLSNDAEWLFDMSPVFAWNDGGGNLAYRDVFWNGATDRSRDSNRAFRAQSAITTTGGAPGEKASGVATSTDSIFQVDWTVSVYDDPTLTDGMVATYVVTNLTGSTYSGIHLGAIADLDVDSLSAWNDGIANEPGMYVGGQGGWGDDTIAYTPQPNFAAVFYQALDPACNDKGVGGQVLDNVDYVYPENAFNTDSVYNWMSTLDITGSWGSNTFQADTITDINVLMACATDQTLGPNDTLRFAFGMAVSSISEADLATKIALLRKAANDACQLCPIVVAGDVNVSGALTSADIIYLVNFVFKGDVAPLPCTANGDVNCSGAVTSADIIYMVNHVFKGQPAPCDICNVPEAQACTP